MPGSARVSRRTVVGAGVAALVMAGGILRPQPVSAVGLSGVTGTVNTDALNVRAGPSTSRPVIGQLYGGDAVACTRTSGKWFKIATGTLSGWVYSPYVTLNPRGPVTTFDRGPTDRPLVALTFDCGADRGYADSILDTLTASGVQASFGITGRWVDANSDLVGRIVNEGHHLINHTLSHRSLTGYSTGPAATAPAQRLGELIATEQRLQNATGQGARPWFRPPYGDYDDSVLNDIAAVGFFENVMWTVDSLGWNGASRDEIAVRCLDRAGNGNIYLFHVMSDSQDGPALSTVIDGLQAQGYGCRTVEQLLGFAAASLDPQRASPPTPSLMAAATETLTTAASPSVA